MTASEYPPPGERLSPHGPTPRPVFERVADYVEVHDDGCHVWTGSLDAVGRPQITMGSAVDGTRHPQRVYRLVWVAAHGAVPRGYDVHHRCENPLCVNLAHLELLDHAEHAAYHGRKQPRSMTCQRGHPWTPENIYVKPSGGRECRACRRLRREP